MSRSMTALMPKPYPHVAIVTTFPLCGELASGIMLRSLFSGWPKDKLTCIVLPRGILVEPAFDVCADYRYIDLAGKVSKKQQGQRGEGCATDTPNRAIRQLKLKASPHSTKSGYILLAQEILAGAFWRRWALQRELRKLRPEIVYSVVGNLAMAKTIALACQSTGLPLYLHITDKYIDALYQHVPLAALVISKSRKWFREAVLTSSGRAAISDAMSQDFAHTYHCEWSWFTTLVSPSNYNPSDHEKRDFVRFVYTGNLGIGRWETLMKIGNALQEIGEDKGISIELDIYSSPDQIQNHSQGVAVPDVVRLQGWVNADKLPEIYHDADVLVHVESFDPEISKYTEFSFSTKLSQYAMSGRCIVGCGPAHLASTRMITESESGIVLSNYSVESKKRLAEIATNQVARKQHAIKARAWAERWVSLERGQNQMLQELQSLVRT